MMKIKAAVKNLSLCFESATKFPHEVIGDKLRMQKVLINLIQNAITFASEGVIMVTFSYNFKTEMIEFKVDDKGIGIKPEK